MTTRAFTLRPATPADDILIATHFAVMWADNNFAPQQMRCDWVPRTLAFSAVVAQAGGAPVGSATA